MDNKNRLLYETIVEDLKIKILNEQYKADEKLPTEIELASQYGVSRITSKRALEELKLLGLVHRKRGSGTFVTSQENMVLNKELDITNMGDDKKIIPIILPFDTSDSGFAQTVRGASEILDENGYYISVYNGVKDFNSEQQLIRRLYENKVKGIIYYPISDRDNLEVLNMLYMASFPIITIDKYFESLPISYVVSDNESGACQAVQYLIDLGHQHIGFVSDLSIESTSSIRNRYFGYCNTLKKNNIMYRTEFVRTSFANEKHRYYDKKVYHNIIKEFMYSGITAIFGVNDLVSSFLMRAAFEMNIKIPDQLSFIGFDNIELAKHLQVPLTTIAQDFYNMGRTAAQSLIHTINGESLPYIQFKIPVDLIKRDSCTKVSL